MKTFFSLFVFTVCLSGFFQAVALEKVDQWKNQPSVNFSDGEANFKLAMDKLLQEHIDKNLTKDDLYRAATAGMLDALNSGEHSWNTLLTPQDLSELQSDLSGQVRGIGIELSFDESTGYARILKVLHNSPSLKAGIKRDDQILSVNGKHFKGKSIQDLVIAVRGKIGESVSLKILRDDKILSLNIKREFIPWTPVTLLKVDASTQLLTIGYFTNETPKLVEDKITAVNNSETKYLIVDLRDNSGGSFDKAVQTADLFIPKDRPIVGTKDRDNKVQSITSKKGLLKKGVNVIVLTNKGTSSGAELFAGALKDELKAKSVGEGTFGKWNAQTIQTLSNGFAIKYSTIRFQTPKGISYENTGLKPDFEVIMPKEVASEVLRVKYEMPKRLELDPQLKAAVEFAKAMQ